MCNAKICNLPPKFNIGDTVQVNSRAGGRKIIGKIGKIISIRKHTGAHWWKYIVGDPVSTELFEYKLDLVNCIDNIEDNCGFKYL